MYEGNKVGVDRVGERDNKGASVDAVRPENVLEFPPDVGLTFFITKSTVDTAGEYLEIEGIMRAHSDGPPVHIHPRQEETFQVVSGTLDVLQNGRWQQVRAGESITVPQGVPHTLKNEHDEDTRALSVLRPAMSFEDFSRTFHRLATTGRIKSLPPKDPSSLIYSAMLFTSYEDTLIVVKPPAFVFKLLAFVGRRLGYRLD